MANGDTLNDNTPTIDPSLQVSTSQPATPSFTLQDLSKYLDLRGVPPPPSPSTSASNVSGDDIGKTVSGIQITHYGYPGDRYWDEDSAKGLTSRGQGIPGYSVGMTAAARLKVFGNIDNPNQATGQQFNWNGRTYRDDDVGDPHITNARIDIFDPMSTDVDKGVSTATAAERSKMRPSSFPSAPTSNVARSDVPAPPGIMDLSQYLRGGASIPLPGQTTTSPVATSQAEPNVDTLARYYRPGPTDQPRNILNIILHSTDGSEKGDINTLTGQTGREVSAHYYTTRDGREFHFVPENDIAFHAGQTINNSVYGNGATIGIEQEHVDGRQDWPDVQVQRTAQQVADILNRHPNLTLSNVLGHSDIAPERKQDPLNFPWDTFRRYVQQYQAASKQPASSQITQTGSQQNGSSPQMVDLTRYLSSG